ncbi:unnamed protein product [Sphagnum balticum]
MLDGEWKAAIGAKVDTLMVGMAKVESMVDSLAEIKVTLLQARQHSKHQELLPKELVHDTPASTTRAAQHDPTNNVLKEMAIIFMSSVATLFSTPSTIKLHSSLGVNEANQKTGVESTTPKASLCQSVGVTNKGVQGDVIDQSTDVDVTEDAIGQVQGPAAVSNVQD